MASAHSKENYPSHFTVQQTALPVQGWFQGSHRTGAILKQSAVKAEFFVPFKRVVL